VPINLANLFKHKHTGIDLGSSSVKVVKLSRQKISLAAIINILPAERAETPVLISRLRQFFTDTGIAGSSAVIAIPGEHTFVRTITLPAMPETELKEAVRWEIKRQIPYAEEESVTDYISRESSEGHIVTFAAAERKNILKYVQIFEGAGVKVAVVDIAPLALMRALNRQTPESFVLADIGSSAIEIIIVRSGVLRIARTVEIGSDLVLNALISSGKTPEESLEIMCSSMTDDMKLPLNQLLREIYRSIDYYKANYKDPDLSKLILAGGICRNQHVIGHIRDAIKMQVDVPNPFTGFSMKDESLFAMGPRFSLAMGLAMRTA